MAKKYNVCVLGATGMVGKETMKDSELVENIMTVYNNILKNLPRNKENIKNMEVKFTMTKPIKIIIK